MVLGEGEKRSGAERERSVDGLVHAEGKVQKRERHGMRLPIAERKIEGQT